MTQVFAAINHRLSEEYGKIELPGPEAKSRCVRSSVNLPICINPLAIWRLFLFSSSTLFHRLLADAKFLHQKLSALKNVSTPSGMLETVVAEKNVSRKGPNAQPVMTVEPVRGGSRIQGIFKSPVTEKPLPTPLPEQAVHNVIGIGRKDDINGRVTARLSSLMSPPASLPAIPREGDKKDGEVTMESAEKEERPSMPNSATVADPSEVAAQLEKEVRNRVPSPPPERSPPREGGSSPISGEKARMFSPSPSHSPHHLVDMTKLVIRSGDES
jgi:hypothetical protein